MAKEEACGATEYAVLAIEYRQSDAELSRMFHELSEVELDHSKRFLQQAERRKEQLTSSVQLDEEFEDDCQYLKRHILAEQASAARYVAMYR